MKEMATPPSIFLLGEPHGQWSLAGWAAYGVTESQT